MKEISAALHRCDKCRKLTLLLLGFQMPCPRLAHGGGSYCGGSLAPAEAPAVMTAWLIGGWEAAHAIIQIDDDEVDCAPRQ